MVRINKRGKKFFSFVKAKGSKLSKSIATYQKEAPQRRAKDIARLKDEITIARLKAQRAKLTKQSSPSSSFGMMDAPIMNMESMIGSPRKRRR